MKVSTIVIAATSVVAAFIAAPGTATSFARESEASYLASRDPQTVTVVAEDFAFTAPEKIQAGPTTIQLVNKGSEMHHVQLVRLEQGKTVADLMGAVKEAGEKGVPSWITWIGGPNVSEPGQSSTATIALTPGNYVFVCLIPSKDGVPHLMKGMMRPLTVTPAVGMPAAMPKADVEIELVDYGFDISTPITAGRHVVKVSVDAPQPHELLMARLAPGKTVDDLLAWMEKEEGPPPGTPAGGTSMIGVGGSNTLTMDFKPGEYALLCFMADNKDGKPHFMHGMMRQITVK